MLLDHNGNIRPLKACANRQKVAATRDPLQNQKENRNPLLLAGGQEDHDSQRLITCETRKIRRFYLDNIMDQELIKAPGPYRSEFLTRHGITPEIRARMVV